MVNLNVTDREGITKFVEDVKNQYLIAKDLLDVAAILKK